MLKINPTISNVATIALRFPKSYDRGKDGIRRMKEILFLTAIAHVIYTRNSACVSEEVCDFSDVCVLLDGWKSIDIV